VSGPSAEEVTGKLHAEREALVASLDEVRRDVRSEIARKKALAVRSIPFVAGGLLLVVGSLVTRRMLRRHSPTPPVERLRLGRYALIELRRS
jgi:hypothetical protein